MSPEFWNTIQPIALIVVSSGLTGFIALKAAKINATSALEKLRFEQKSKILLEVSEIAESFFQAFNHYNTALLGAFKLTQAPVEPVLEKIHLGIAGAQVKKAHLLQMKMSEQANTVLVAQSKLMLLGEAQCRQTLERLHISIISADKAYGLDGSEFALKNWEETTKMVRDARESFYREMETAFKRMKE